VNHVADQPVHIEIVLISVDFCIGLIVSSWMHSSMMAGGLSSTSAVGLCAFHKTLPSLQSQVHNLQKCLSGPFTKKC